MIVKLIAQNFINITDHPCWMREAWLKKDVSQQIVEHKKGLIHTSIFSVYQIRVLINNGLVIIQMASLSVL